MSISNRKSSVSTLAASTLRIWIFCYCFWSKWFLFYGLWKKKNFLKWLHFYYIFVSWCFCWNIVCYNNFLFLGRGDFFNCFYIFVPLCGDPKWVLNYFVGGFMKDCKYLHTLSRKPEFLWFGMEEFNMWLGWVGSVIVFEIIFCLIWYGVISFSLILLIFYLDIIMLLLARLEAFYSSSWFWLCDCSILLVILLFYGV